jgi:carbon-monoxide dehydrogenase small subunit
MEEAKLVVELTVNGSPHPVSVEPRRTLAAVLREELGLTGTHLACEHDVCGACTVLVDRRSAPPYPMLIGQAHGASVQTIKGLSSDGRLDHPLQRAFREHHSFQCGYCTPGFAMAAVELLADNPAPTEHDVRLALSGSFWRCTGYQSIIDGLLRASEAA